MVIFFPMNNAGCNNGSSDGVKWCQSPQDNGEPMTVINSKPAAHFVRGCNCVCLELTEGFSQAGWSQSPMLRLWDVEKAADF